MPFKNPHPLYQTWQNMRQRCRNPRTPLYRFYGAKGVTVCERWDVFANFAADMGPKPSSKHSIDRIDPAGNYEPSNCRWAVGSVQSRNQRVTRTVTVEGATLVAADIADLAGVKTDTVVARAARGLALDRIMSPELQRDPAERLRSILHAADVSAAKKRDASHCKRGHEFTAANTQITSVGRRRCRACTALRDAKYRQGRTQRRASEG